MKNLKITLHLKSPLFIDRNTTIDGILLSSYYALLKKNGINLEFDKEHSRVDFIHSVDGVFSGSIWYIDEQEFVSFDFNTIVKKPEYRKIFDNISTKKSSDAKFKAFMAINEVMNVSKIHFYIRADVDVVVTLLSDVKHIGKKQSIGFGEIASFDVEEIDVDKGFMLDEFTPSKPLPTKSFNVKTKKVAFMRRKPPYWLKEDLEPCYMPTTALYELSDITYTQNIYNSCEDIAYIHNVDFLFQKANSETVETDSSIQFRKVDDYHDYRGTKRAKCVWIEDNDSLKCSITNSIKPLGMKNTIREFMIKEKSAFSDYVYFLNDDFLSYEAIWAIENIENIAYALVDDSRWIFLQGKNAKDGTRLKDFVKSPTLLKPPFSINLKDTQNAQHISFKGKVSISNAYFTVQYGDRQLQIDTQLLINAIQDIDRLTESKKITKTHLCGNFKDAFYPKLSKDAKSENWELIISDFQKKYNKDIRLFLNSVSLDG